MITKRYVRDEIIYKQLGEALKPFGFRYIKSKSSVMRSGKGGFDRIIIPVTDYNPVFWVGMTLMIRIDCVENIVNLFMEDTMDKEYMNVTPTSVTTLERLTGIEYFEVQTDEEVKNVSQNFIRLIADKGMKFIDQHHDVFMVNDEKKKQILCDYEKFGWSPVRRTLMQSLTLMKLCNDPDFEVLLPNYLENFIPYSGEEVTGPKALKDLVEYLRKM